MKIFEDLNFEIDNKDDVALSKANVLDKV